MEQQDQEYQYQASLRAYQQKEVEEANRLSELQRADSEEVYIYNIYMIIYMICMRHEIIYIAISIILSYILVLLEHLL